MRKKEIQPWLDALRSGKYKQTRNYLKTIKGYCCLGVLCAIEKMNWSLNNNNGYTYFISDGENASSLLPTSLKIKYDINIRMQNELVHLNDVLKLSFPEIADHIEKHYIED